MIRILGVLLLAGGLFGACQSDGTKKDGEKAASGADTVWVSRPDGSMSCEPGSGRSLEDDASRLTDAGVELHEKAKGNDGLAHAQVCGAATGDINAFRISRDHLDQAKEAGFSELSKEAVLRK